MGLVKVRKISAGKVKFIHQLNSDGTAYAEDVTVESQVPGRLDYFEKQDGRVGTLSFGFIPMEGDFSSTKFPEE